MQQNVHIRTRNSKLFVKPIKKLVGCPQKLLDVKYSMEMNIFGRITPVEITAHSKSNNPTGINYRPNGI